MGKNKKNLKKNNQNIVNIMQQNEISNTFITEVSETESNELDLTTQLEETQITTQPEENTIKEIDLLSIQKNTITIVLDDYLVLKKNLKTSQEEIERLKMCVDEKEKELKIKSKQLIEFDEKLSFYREQYENITKENSNLKNELEEQKNKLESNSIKLLSLIKNQIEKTNLENDKMYLEIRSEQVKYDQIKLSNENDSLVSDEKNNLNKQVYIEEDDFKNKILTENENIELDGQIIKQDALVKQRRRARRF